MSVMDIQRLWSIELIAVFQMLVRCTEADDARYEEVVNGILFNRVVTWNNFNLSHLITHMERDAHLQGTSHLLMSIGSALLTLDINDMQPQIIAGDFIQSGYKEGAGTTAAFDGLSGFIQDRKGTMLMLDSKNKLLRKLSRRNNVTQLLIGKQACIVPLDGDFNTACFLTLSAIVKRSNRIFYVLDQIVRKIDFEERIVTTIEAGEGSQIITIDLDNRILYFSHNDLYALKYYGAQSQLIKQNPGLSVDGIFAHVTLGRVRDAVLLDEGGTLLLADITENKLRVVNLQTGYVTSICTGEAIQKDGRIDECAFTEIMAISRWNSTDVITATAAGMRILKMNYMETTTLSTTTSQAHGLSSCTECYLILLVPTIVTVIIHHYLAFCC